MKKTKPIKVNICWELNNERKCETMSQDQAYATRKYCEKNDGVVFWFQPLEDWCQGARLCKSPGSEGGGIEEGWLSCHSSSALSSLPDKVV